MESSEVSPLTFDSMDKILWCDHSNETSLAYLQIVLFVFQHYTRLNLEFWSNFDFGLSCG